MKTIWLVKITSEIGVEAFYVGAARRLEALEWAAERGHFGEAVEVKEIPNKFGVQAGEWRSAI